MPKKRQNYLINLIKNLVNSNNFAQITKLALEKYVNMFELAGLVLSRQEKIFYNI